VQYFRVLAQQRDRRQKSLALQAVAIELLGHDVRRGRERDAALEQGGEQVAQDHRVRNVRDGELVEADDSRLGCNVVGDEIERVLNIAVVLQALVHGGHEAMEVLPRLVLERQRAEEQIHHEGFAAADAAPEVKTAHGSGVRAARERRESAAPSASSGPGAHEITLQTVQRRNRFGLRRVCGELAALDAAAVLREKAGH